MTRMARLMALASVGVVLLAGTASAESTEERLRRLEEQLRKTEAEIQQLRDQLQQQRAINQATQKQSEQAAEENKAAVAEAKKGVELPDWVRKTTLFGDVRFRDEGFYHQPVTEAGLKPDPNLRPALATSATARNRVRIRARLGVKVTLSDELSATVRMASGDPNNPVSTNETLTGDFTRKHVNLDWAFLTFTPGKSFGIRPGVVSITGGKFPNPIFRVGQLVFDDDLSPEGATQTLSLLDKPVGGLDQVKVHVLEWTYNEVANGPDGWMFGGQVNPSGHLGNLQVEAGLGQYWWDNPNLIAQAINTNSSLINTNLLTKNSSGSITGYQSAFNQTNATLSLTWPNVISTQPLQGFTDYVYNWQAATDDAHGVMGGLKLGQTKVRGDWAVSYYYEWLGQEAAISSFTYDDFGFGGTNQEGSVVQLDYQLLNPLTLTARSAFTNYINRPENSTNPTMTRLQLDAQVKF